MLLVQSSFHANNSTENENVIASPAQNCYVIIWDWLAMSAKDDTADPSSNEILTSALHWNLKFHPKDWKSESLRENKNCI